MSNISSVIHQSAEMGEDIFNQFKSDKAVRTANAANNSFRTAILACKIQMQYQKAVKTFDVEEKISFLEQ